MKDPVLYRIIRRPLRAIFMAIYKPEIIGENKIPQTGRIILAGNHTNYFDCILIGCATKRCVLFLAKDELMKGPLKIIFKNMGIIPVNRRTKDKAALATAIEYLNDEKLIGIFPEGTINRTEDIIMPFKFGAVKMARDTRTPIIPFVITGKYKPFERNIKIQFMEPMTVSENLEEANNKLMKVVSDELMKAGVTK